MAGVLLVATGCDDDDAGAGSNASERPEVTFAAGGHVLEIPPQVPSGFVDIRIEALESGPAHLLIGQLVDGMSFDEFEALPEDERGSVPFTFSGGNGTIAPGDEALLTLILTPGQLHRHQHLRGRRRRAAVRRRRPFHRPREQQHRGGTGGRRHDHTRSRHAIAAPKGFDATGVWRFENRDTEEPHEAALVRLADGKTVPDFIARFADQQGPRRPTARTAYRISPRAWPLR